MVASIICHPFRAFATNETRSDERRFLGGANDMRVDDRHGGGCRAAGSDRHGRRIEPPELELQATATGQASNDEMVVYLKR